MAKAKKKAKGLRTFWLTRDKVWPGNPKRADYCAFTAKPKPSQLDQVYGEWGPIPEDTSLLSDQRRNYPIRYRTNYWHHIASKSTWLEPGGGPIKVMLVLAR